MHAAVGPDHAEFVVEFIAIARALDADPIKLFRDFIAGKGLPKGPAKRASK